MRSIYETDELALDTLAQRARQALAYLGEPPENWVPSHASVDHDVAVVGAGQSGLTVAFALRRAGIGNVIVFDQAPAGEEGIWRNIARMRNLRSSKLLPGPEQGLPELTFQAWYEAAFGAASYADLGRARARFGPTTSRGFGRPPPFPWRTTLP